MITKDLHEKVAKIRELFQGKRVVVCLSGGVDSSTMLVLAKMFAKEVIAVTFVSENFRDDLMERAKSLTRRLGVRHYLLTHDVFSIPEFVKNVPDKCYYCKRAMCEKVKKLADSLGFDMIVDGSNLSDLLDVRHGMRALEEFGVVSPYILAGITKEEIRKLARSLGLEWYDDPPESCYAMRVMRELEVTREKIRRIKKAEEFLRKTFNFRLVRVRDHGDLARIELLPEDIYSLKPKTFALIAKKLKDLGYKFVTLDLAGYHESLLKTKKIQENALKL